VISIEVRGDSPCQNGDVAIEIFRPIIALDALSVQVLHGVPAGQDFDLQGLPFGDLDARDVRADPF